MDKKIKPAGSYSVSDFRETRAEIERLEKQATISLELEKKIWLKYGLKNDTKVLDLACGLGILSCEMAKIAENGFVVGVDISEELLEKARYFKELKNIKNIRFQAGDIYDKNMVAEKFDWIYARFLFQHLYEPNKALSNIHSFLNPGGKICIVDVDDRWLTFSPDSDIYISFTEKAAEGQKQNGGDRFVGHKLGQYLHNAGFGEIRTDIIPLTTADLGAKTFLDLTTGFKSEQIVIEQKEEAKKELEKIYDNLKAPFNWGAIGIFIATGIKKPA